MTNHIRLPAERIEQLRMIAEAEGKTITEVVADLIRSKVDAGVIPGDVPGIDVTSTGPAITIRARGFEAEIPADQGPTLGDLLRGAGNVTSDPERKKRWIEGLAALSGIKVKRAGSGLKLISPITGQEIPLNLDVAADLGDQIERKAAE